MKSFGPQMLRSLSTGFLTTRRQNNHEIYDKGLALLRSTKSVLLSSSVVDIERGSPGPYGHAIVAAPRGANSSRTNNFFSPFLHNWMS